MSERESYKAEKLELSSLYDKSILILSTSIIVLSITFLDKISKEFSLELLLWLHLSWSSLTLSLVVALFSLLSSQKAINDMIISLDKASEPKMFWSKITGICNWLSFVSFCLGMFFILVFLGINFSNHA